MKYFLTQDTHLTISLEQVLWFINYYWDINEIDYKWFTFNDVMEFKLDFHKDYFESLLLVDLECAIKLNMWFCPVRVLIAEWYISEKTKRVIGIDICSIIWEMERKVVEHAKEQKKKRQEFHDVLFTD
jgi:hypothetical protein